MFRYRFYFFSVLPLFFSQILFSLNLKIFLIIRKSVYKKEKTNIIHSKKFQKINKITFELKNFYTLTFQFQILVFRLQFCLSNWQNIWPPFASIIWWLCYVVEGILLAWFRFTCPLRAKDNCKSIQSCFGWSPLSCDETNGSGLFQDDCALWMGAQNGHWMVWWVWELCES